MCVIVKPRRNEEAQAPKGLLSHRKKNYIDSVGVLDWQCHQIKVGYQSKRAGDKISH
jgi:hypothetical protein